MTAYDQKFFEILGDSAVRSASEIIPKILQGFDIKSVFDVGCGEGGWLKVWQQAGYQHINEQPFEFWRDIFQKKRYRQFDWIRPQLVGQKAVEPWYRYNTFVYAHESIFGELPFEVRATEIPPAQPVVSYSPLLY